MSGLTTFVGMAHPWMCDAMGHVNARHYLAMFDDASLQLLDHIADPGTAGAGWADVRCEIDYLAEIGAGTALLITSSVEHIGTTSLTLRHVLRGSNGGTVRARARIVTVRFDLAARRPVPLAAGERSRAARLPGAEAGAVARGRPTANKEYEDE